MEAEWPKHFEYIFIYYILQNLMSLQNTIYIVNLAKYIFHAYKNRIS